MLSRILIAAIRFYQRGISPMLGPCCRFTPTCSEYAVLSITKYGVWRGGFRAFRRLLRCHPFQEGGVDLP